MATCYSSAVRRSASRAGSRPPVILRVQTPPRRASWTPTLCSEHAPTHGASTPTRHRRTAVNDCGVGRHIKRRRSSNCTFLPVPGPGRPDSYAYRLGRAGCRSCWLSTSPRTASRRSIVSASATID